MSLFGGTEKQFQLMQSNLVTYMYKKEMLFVATLVEKRIKVMV